MTKEIALVTGAASGIGAAVSRRLAEAGVGVALCDVNAQAGQALAEEIGGKFIACDVRDYEGVVAAVDACVATLGVPDYAHLNAGIMTVPANDPYLAIEDVSLEQYRRIQGINIDGVFFGLKALLPHMRAKGGAVTITASIAGLTSVGVDPLYALSKYAMIGLGRSVAEANRGTNIRVNVICPGVVDTAIIPDDFRAPQFHVMQPEVMAAEIVDLLFQGENGEVRVKVGDRPAFRVEAMNFRAE